MSEERVYGFLCIFCGLLDALLDLLVLHVIWVLFLFFDLNMLEFLLNGLDFHLLGKSLVFLWDVDLEYVLYQIWMNVHFHKLKWSYNWVVAKLLSKLFLFDYSLGLLLFLLEFLNEKIPFEIHHRVSPCESNWA